MFTLPPDFLGGGIANVPGILMKQSEQTRGTPLAGLAVKVTNGFFLIGLSSRRSPTCSTTFSCSRSVRGSTFRSCTPMAAVRSLRWRKGPPGDRAFADAFAAWDKK